MHKFKVGQRCKVLAPKEMGVAHRYQFGDIMEVTGITNGDAEDEHCYTYCPNWIEEGFLELIGEEEKEEFDITTLYEGSAKEGKVITKGLFIREFNAFYVFIDDGGDYRLKVKKEDLPNLIAGLMEFMNDE